MYYKLKAPRVPVFEASGGYYDDLYELTLENYSFEGAEPFSYESFRGADTLISFSGSRAFTIDEWRKYFKNRTEIESDLSWVQPWHLILGNMKHEFQAPFLLKDLTAEHEFQAPFLLKDLTAEQRWQLLDCLRGDSLKEQFAAFLIKKHGLWEFCAKERDAQLEQVKQLQLARRRRRRRSRSRSRSRERGSRRTEE